MIDLLFRKNVFKNYLFKCNHINLTDIILIYEIQKNKTNKKKDL